MFIKNQLKGFNAKLITESIFRDSECYETYPFGYESSFSRLIGAVDYKNSSDTFSQLRSMPDLLVFDSLGKDVYLVECKYRNAPKLSNVRFKKSDIEKYQKYWKGCILAVVVPLGEFLYAQIIDNLNLNNGRIAGDNIYFDLEKDFVHFTQVFNKVDKKIIDKYKTFIKTISEKEK